MSLVRSTLGAAYLLKIRIAVDLICFSSSGFIFTLLRSSTLPKYHREDSYVREHWLVPPLKAQ